MRPIVYKNDSAGFFWIVCLNKHDSRVGMCLRCDLFLDYYILHPRNSSKFRYSILMGTRTRPAGNILPNLTQISLI